MSNDITHGKRIFKHHGAYIWNNCRTAYTILKSMSNKVICICIGISICICICICIFKQSTLLYQVSKSCDLILCAAMCTSPCLMGQSLC